MVINITFSNKTFYLLIGVLVLLVSFGLVYAYGGSQPSVMGHSFGEIGMDCQIYMNDTNLGTVTWECPEGRMISGGCAVKGEHSAPLGYEDLVGSYPSENGWTCQSSHADRHVRVFLYCCK
ncbi:MAG: hypothetical protein WC494_02125 [Candidatus Pacearchaeota archaeon]